MIKFLKKIKSKIYSKPAFPRNKELQRKFSNKSIAYILGTSSTVNELNLCNLELNSLKISVGNFFEHKDIDTIHPDIHLFAASHPPLNEEVLKLWWTRCDQVLPKSIPVLIEKRDQKIALEVFVNREVYFYGYGGDYPIDFTKNVPAPWSISLTALQFAVYCQVKEIFVVGVEHEWRQVKPYLHFYSHDQPSLEYYLIQVGLRKAFPDRPKNPNPGKGALYRYYSLYQQHERLKEFAALSNIEIYNVDPNSSFDVFEKKIKQSLIVNG